jgi:hypothetical protein
VKKGSEIMESIEVEVATLLEQAGKTFHSVCEEEEGMTHHVCGTITGVVITPKPFVELLVSLTTGPGAWPVVCLEYWPPGERSFRELYEGEESSGDPKVEEHVMKGGWLLRTRDNRGERGGFYGRWRGSLYLH